MYHSFLEQIKMLCFHFFVARLMATTTIEPDSDLEQMRAWIERFKEDEEEEVHLSSLVLTGGGILGHVAGSEIAPSWSPMRPKIQFWRPEFRSWSPAGDW